MCNHNKSITLLFAMFFLCISLLFLFVDEGFESTAKRLTKELNNNSFEAIADQIIENEQSFYYRDDQEAEIPKEVKELFKRFSEIEIITVRQDSILSFYLVNSIIGPEEDAHLLYTNDDEALFSRVCLYYNDYIIEANANVKEEEGTLYITGIWANRKGYVIVECIIPHWYIEYRYLPT